VATVFRLALIIMANTKLMIDLSTGLLSLAVNSTLVTLSNIRTPWKDALKLQEVDVTTSELPANRPRSSLVVLDLPLSINSERHREMIKRFGAQTTPSEVHPALERGELMPRWRETTGIILAELNPILLAHAASEIGSPSRAEFRYPAKVTDTQIQHLLLALRVELEEGCPAGRLFGESLATTLAVHLVHRYAVFPEKETYRGGLPLRRLRAVTEYMEAHLEEQISLRQLADLAQMSPYYFGHLFKQTTGLSPHQFFLRRRIQKAKYMLARGHSPLSQISQALGFASQAHFTTTFRKLVGITPFTYRNKY
jgi:AraC-like DNA-binding protein